ncbi:uncharacterized protein V1478_009935 [Vespula squamosa]|uniref:Uncharacterized protein n=1 Tax=Vespula squamosa TaxID=30214 RepID=A0ABD2AJU9_VESSQ
MDDKQFPTNESIRPSAISRGTPIATKIPILLRSSEDDALQRGGSIEVALLRTCADHVLSHAEATTSLLAEVSRERTHSTITQPPTLFLLHVFSYGQIDNLMRDTNDLMKRCFSISSNYKESEEATSAVPPATSATSISVSASASTSKFASASKSASKSASAIQYDKHLPVNDVAAGSL